MQPINSRAQILAHLLTALPKAQAALAQAQAALPYAHSPAQPAQVQAQALTAEIGPQIQVWVDGLTHAAQLQPAQLQPAGDLPLAPAQACTQVLLALSEAHAALEQAHAHIRTSTLTQALAEPQAALDQACAHIRTSTLTQALAKAKGKALAQADQMRASIKTWMRRLTLAKKDLAKAYAHSQPQPMMLPQDRALMIHLPQALCALDQARAALAQALPQALAVQDQARIQARIGDLGQAKVTLRQAQACAHILSPQHQAQALALTAEIRVRIQRWIHLLAQAAQLQPAETQAQAHIHTQLVAALTQAEAALAQTQPAVVAVSAEAPSSGSKRPAEDSTHSPPAKSRVTGKKKPNARTGGRLMVSPAASSEEDANGSSALAQEGVTEEDVALLVGFQNQIQNSSNSVSKKGKEPQASQRSSAPAP